MGAHHKSSPSLFFVKIDTRLMLEFSLAQHTEHEVGPQKLYPP